MHKKYNDEKESTIKSIPLLDALCLPFFLFLALDSN